MSNSYRIIDILSEFLRWYHGCEEETKPDAMRVEIYIIKTLAESADLVNTINGGRSIAHIHKYKLDDHYMVSVKVPGVDKKSLKVEIHDGQLFIFQLLHLEDGIDIPFMVASIDISEKVIKREIRTNYHGINLNIVMPFAEWDESDSRDIKIG